MMAFSSRWRSAFTADERVGHLSDACFERRDLGNRVIALGLFAGDAIAQLLDLALDAEDRRAFVLAAARHEHAPAKTSPVRVAIAAPKSIRPPQRRG